jgi:hypothetical protein
MNLQLLSVLGIGFAQGLYALDAADGVTEHGTDVVNSLIQALLQYVSDQLFDKPCISKLSIQISRL